MTLLDLERDATVACLGPKPSASALEALGGDPRIWQLYREMIRNRLRGEIKVALRRSCDAMGEAAFERIFAHHLEHEPPRSRPFHGIVHDFASSAIAFLQTSAGGVAAFVPDLLAFESTLWAVGDLDDRVTDTVQELSFDAIACFTPAHRVLALKHAVHEAAGADGGYRSADVWLVIYRKPEEKSARTFVLNATSHALVVALQTGRVTITEAVHAVAAQRKLKVDAAFLDGLCTVLADFVERGVLLGSKG